MKNSKKLFALLLAAVCAASLTFSGCSGNTQSSSSESSASESAASESSAEETPVPESSDADEESGEFGVFTAVAGENGTTYDNLFDVILADEYTHYWHDFSAAVMGEAMADDTVAMLKGSISSDVYGEEAVKEMAETGGFAFDCWYINNAKSFTFKGDTVTIRLTDGSEETHTYKYLGSHKIGEGETMLYNGQEMDPSFDCDVYESTDEAGEFNYIFLRDDTMETTYHIEFRYGSSMEDLQKYLEGPYAYWLSAGMAENASEETIENCIALFCLENLDCTTHSEDALAQITDFVGTWDADLSNFGDEYKDTELYTVIDENGHGETYMNGEKSADYEAFAYDNGEAGDGEGVYVAFSNTDYETSHVSYAITEEDGQTVWTLTNGDGVIRYVKRV